MSRILAAGVTFACLVLEWSCVKYQPHDLNPVRTEAQFHARIFEGRADAEGLTKFALQFHPELEIARAKVAVAEAALITARQRINPSLTADGGYNRTPESVAAYSVSLAFVIETAGKRGYRILEAEKRAEAARIAVYEASWLIRSRIRTALLSYWSAQRKRELWQSENDLRAEVAAIYEKRVAVGDASIPEWNAARAGQATAVLNLRSAEGEITQALAAIADAAGLPVQALEGKLTDLTALGTPAFPEALPLLTVQRAGLVHRADIRRSLIEYEAADARLRLALANQYPNITLSPSYAFQEGFAAYTLGSVIESLPLLHRNRGPIAEQEALRRQAEGEFLALQAKAAGETELALRRYVAAVREWRDARDTVGALQLQRETALRASFKAGESDRLDLTQARLETVTTQRSEMEALLRARLALGEMEDAVQAPLTPAVSPETTN